MKILTGLQQPPINFDGQPMTDGKGPVTIGSLIANALATGQSQGQEVRVMDLALRIFKAKDSLELEDIDFALVRETVVANQVLNNMAKAAALAALDSGTAGTSEKEGA